MASILKVDTIQDQAGNNIINESGNVITIGASGDTITVPAGATVSGFTSAGIDDNATSVAITIDSNENVGIGTAAPDTLLSLEKNNAPVIQFKDTSGATDEKIWRVNGLNDAYRIQTWNDALNSNQVAYQVMRSGVDVTDHRFYTEDSERMRLTTTGLGIGTSSPATTLHIKSNTPILTFEETDQSNRQFQIGSFGNAYAINDATNSQFRYILDNSGNHIFNEGGVDCDFRIESNNNTNMLFVDGGQDRVGIGKSNPQNKLDISALTWDDGILIKNTGNFNTGIIADANRSSVGGGLLNLQGRWNGTEVASVIFQAGSDTTNKDDGEIVFRTASAGTPTERVRITSSGYLLAGKTSASIATAGVELDPIGRIGATRDGNVTFLFNRLNSDGEIGRFQKDGTTVGSIHSHNSAGIRIESESSLELKSDNANGLRLDSSAVFRPQNDNTNDLGKSTHRWNDLFLGGGLFIGGTGSANKLSDYEEGTWTPTYVASGNQYNSITYDGTTGGLYTKVGKLVTCTGFIRTDAVTEGSVSGILRVGGLPFTIVNNTGSTLDARGAVALANQEGFDATHTPNNANLINNQNFFDLEKLYGSSDDAVAIPVTGLANGANKNQLCFTVTYFTDA